MEIITTYQTPGLAPFLVMLVLVVLIRRTRRTWHRPGSGLTADVYVPPSWQGAMVADGTAADQGKRRQRTANRYVFRESHRYSNLGDHPLEYDSRRNLRPLAPGATTGAAQAGDSQGEPGNP